MTGDELDRARRHLLVSLTLARPGSRVRAPILAQISAIDAELAQRGRSVPPSSEVTGSRGHEQS